MDSDIVGSILLQVVLIAVNAVFACAEIAVVSCNDAKLEKMAQEGNKKAAKLFRLTEQPSRFLATIQVVITLSGFLGSAFAAENFSGRFVSVLVDAGVQIPEKTLDAIAVVLITLLLSYITLIFGELVPKRLAMHNAEKIALGVSGLVTTASKIFAPLVGLLTVSTNGILRLFGIDPNEDDDQVTEEEIKAAYEKVDDSLVEVIRKSLVNIREYHEKQKRNSWFDAKPDGTILGQKMTALASVGVYVPGGKAAYPSSVLMNIVPAKVAGVEKIVMVTPPNKEGEVTPATLVAANEAGATHIYKVGGAQAIGALAYGTESIEKVDKIVGPGNIYVALAKKAVYGHVSIDSIAGPSEILVLADDTANPHFVAADLLSQAEHDELASAILVTTSKTLGEKVQEEIEGYLKKLSRAEIIEKSLENFGYILEAETLDEALEVVNAIASEHLEIVTANPFEVMTKVRNAGAIFIGEYSSEPLGDYFAGPNHVLPTNGTAKFFSPLNVDDFVKKSSIIYYSKDALKAIHKDIETFAQAEGLTAHANSIAVRFEEE